MVLGMSKSSLANLLWSLGGSPRQDPRDGCVPGAKLSRALRALHWHRPMGAGSLVTQPHFKSISGPHQAPQNSPQPTQPARLAVLGMETSSSSTCSLWEGKDTSQFIPGAPRGGWTLGSMGGECWQERLGDALR